jgi:hypothetical protein
MLDPGENWSFFQVSITFHLRPEFFAGPEMFGGPFGGSLGGLSNCHAATILGGAEF